MLSRLSIKLKNEIASAQTCVKILKFLNDKLLRCIIQLIKKLVV